SLLTAPLLSGRLFRGSWLEIKGVGRWWFGRVLGVLVQSLPKIRDELLLLCDDLFQLRNPSLQLDTTRARWYFLRLAHGEERLNQHSKRAKASSKPVNGYNFSKGIASRGVREVPLPWKDFANLPKTGEHLTVSCEISRHGS